MFVERRFYGYPSMNPNNMMCEKLPVIKVKNGLIKSGASDLMKKEEK
jgi:hypothetical protein